MNGRDIVHAHLAPPSHYRNAENRRATFDTIFLSNEYKNNLVNSGIYHDGVQGYKCAYCPLYLKRLDAHELKYHTFSVCPQATRQLFKNQTLRKESFRKFKIARSHYKDNFQELAQNGFYYYGKKVEIRCACCQIIIIKLNKNDNAQAIHRKWSPECHFNAPSAPPCWKPEEIRVEPPQWTSIYPKLPALDNGVTTGKIDTIPTAPPQPEDDIMCKICFDAPRDTCFLPCAHVATCSACAKRCKDCCVCRAKIKERFSVFLQ